MPAEAKRHNAEGLEAFARYYFELLEYTIQTNDPEPLKRATSEQCELCARGFIDPATANRDAGAWSAGGEYDPKFHSSQLVGDKGGIVAFSYKQEELIAYNSDGTVFSTLHKAQEPVVGSFGTAFDRDWKVVSINVDGGD